MIIKQSGAGGCEASEISSAFHLTQDISPVASFTHGRIRTICPVRGIIARARPYALFPTAERRVPRDRRQYKSIASLYGEPQKLLSDRAD